MSRWPNRKPVAGNLDNQSLSPRLLKETTCGPFCRSPNPLAASLFHHVDRRAVAYLLTGAIFAISLQLFITLKRLRDLDDLHHARTEHNCNASDRLAGQKNWPLFSSCLSSDFFQTITQRQPGR